MSDGSNGPSVLNQTGVVRSDIRSSSCRPERRGQRSIPDHPAYHRRGLDLRSAGGSCRVSLECDSEGRYSLYSDGVTNQNYLRGVRAADANGTLSFQSIFPGCYQGRWPHIHFEVYQSLAAAQ